MQGRFTRFVVAGLVAPLLLAACGKKKERFPEKGDTAFLFEAPKGWAVSSFHDRANESVKIVSPDGFCTLRMTLAKNPAAMTMSHTEFAKLLEEDGFHKTGDFTPITLSGLQGGILRGSKIIEEKSMWGAVRFFRVDADHMITITHMAETRATKEESAALDKLIESIEIARASPAPSPMPDDTVLELRYEVRMAHQKGDAPEEMKCLNELLQRAPDDAEAYFSRQALFQKMEYYGDAIDDLDKALALDATMAKAYLSRGIVRARISDYPRAVANFDEFLKLQPGSAEGYKDRGSVRVLMRQYDLALADFEEALRIEPENMKALAGRGRVYTKTGQYEKALADFSRALELQPYDEYYHYERSLTYRLMGEYEKAETDSVLAIHAKPLEPAYLCADAWLRATCPDAKFRDGKGAVRLATQACEITRWKNAQSLDVLAAAEAELGQWDDAVKYEQKALGVEEAAEKDAQLLKDYAARLALYAKKEPYREGEMTNDE